MQGMTLIFPKIYYHLYFIYLFNPFETLPNVYIGNKTYITLFLLSKTQSPIKVPL